MATQQTEVLASKATATPGSPVLDVPATQRNADYLDYGKRAQGAAEAQSQAYDSAVGFGGANKGSAAMAPAQANLGQASVHGIWSYQGSKPFVVNGRLYSSMGDTTQCVDAASGRVLWSRNLRDVRRPGYPDDILTPPAVVNGKLFVGTRWGWVYALSAETGEVIWKVDIGEPVSFQPAVAMGRVYVGTDRGSIFCLETGDPRDDGWMMWGGNARHNGR
jgi:outer membrane protein assembly factor BamB